MQVAYESDVRQAEQVIKEVADAMWGDDAWRGELLEEPEVWGVERVGPGGVDIRLVVKTQPASQFRVMRELRIRLKEALDEAGIQAPAAVPTVTPPPA